LRSKEVLSKRFSGLVLAGIPSCMQNLKIAKFRNSCINKAGKKLTEKSVYDIVEAMDSLTGLGSSGFTLFGKSSLL